MTQEKTAEPKRKFAIYKRGREDKPLSERLPEHVSEQIYQYIGQASTCWELPENAGIFHAKEAADIAFELCHFIAGLIEEGKK